MKATIDGTEYYLDGDPNGWYTIGWDQGDTECGLSVSVTLHLVDQQPRFECIWLHNLANHNEIMYDQHTLPPKCGGLVRHAARIAPKAIIEIVEQEILAQLQD